MIRSAKSARPTLLVATKEPYMGGAERMIVRLLEAASGELDVALGLVEKPPSGAGTIPWDGPVVGPRSLLQGRWDVVHTHLFLPGLLARVRRLWDRSFRWVHTVHYDDYGALSFGRLRRWLDRRWIFPAADELVAVGPAVAAGLGPGLAARTIPNAIPLPEPEGEEERGSGGPEAPGRPGARGPGGAAPGSGPVLGTVAMLRPEKGVDDLVRAVDALRGEHPGLRLRVAGSGPEEERLRALVRALGLEDAVELTGWVGDLDGFYRSLDVYVQPSRQEAFGLATLEAMRFRLPIVAAAVGNLPRLLGDGAYGTLVPREGAARGEAASDRGGAAGREPDRGGGAFPARLAAAVEGALERLDDHRERAARGLARWREELDPRAMEAAYLELYRRLLAPGVCIVAPIVTHRTGGLPRQIHLQSRELHRRGYRVLVLQRRDPGRDRGRDSGGPWSHVRFLETPDLLPGGGEGSLRERLRGLAFVLFGSLRLLRHRHRIDLVHAHQLYSPTLVGAVARVVAGIPLVSRVTAAGAYGEAARLREALPFLGLRRLAFRAVDRLVVLTDEMREEVRSLGFPDRVVRTIPNSVEIPGEPALPPGATASTGGVTSTGPGASTARGEEPFRLLFVGRLSTEKSLETLLDAAEILHGRGWRVAVDLVGGGDPDRNAEPALRRRAEGLEVPVRFHGRADDVAPFYRRAGAFVLPSVSEGMSNALLEAMASGVVPVASDIGANRFVVTDGEDGLLFPRGSAEALAERLERLLRSARGDGAELRRLAAAARRTAGSRFSTEAVGARLDALYRELLEP